VADAIGADAYLEWGRGCDFLHGWSGGVWNILDQQIGRRHRDVSGLSVVEFLEKIGSKLGVFSDEGVKLMAGRGRGVDGQV